MPYGALTIPRNTLLTGRILIAVLFLISGINKIIQPAAVQAYMAALLGAQDRERFG